MSRDRNLHRGEQREIRWNWRAGCSLRCARDRERPVRGHGKTDPAPPHATDGGRMTNYLPIRPSTTLAILALGSVLLLFQPFAAAVPPAKKDTPPPPAARDGSLFTALVPVLRHPRCMNCHSMRDFTREGDDGHPHAMNVRRGAEGHGVTAEKCRTRSE